MALQEQDIKRVKGQGFLLNRGTEEFSGRIITENGVLSAAQMRCLSEAAEKYGNGKITFTSRLTVELPGIAYENITPFIEFVGQEGMVTGGTGSKVRPVVSCKGTTCVFGLYDTQELAREIHERFYVAYHDVTLPHKFKIAVGGCPNNCVKPDLNDLGVIGQRVPSHDLSKCRGCKVCQIEKACPIGASRLGESRLDWNEEMCNHCGRCVGKCPFGVVGEEKCGYAVYIGGRWGKRTAQGRMLAHVFTSEEEVLEVIERALTLFRDEGNAGERFSDTVSRLGFENVQNRLLGR